MAKASESEPEADTDDWDEYVQPCLCRAPAYPYRQLIGNDIRLVNILPGQGALECVLHQMPLTEEQMYYALSYVWGNPREMEEILLEGQPFKVSRNLYEVLRQLREQPESPQKIGYPDDYFWIDAICLNQDDLQEKGHQVPRMIDIYNASLKVIIWLGPNKPIAKSVKDSRGAVSSHIDPVDFLRRGNISADSIVKLLFEKAESLWTDWELPDEADEEDPVLRGVFGESYDAVLQASAEILSRPWFVRAWTVQEYSLETNSAILAGRHGVNSEKLIKLLKIFASHHRIILLTSGYIRINALDLIERRWRQKYSTERQGRKSAKVIAECILDILSCVSNAEATDPRDQLYALLSLVGYFVGKHLPIELKPDYRLSFESVYWRYTAYLLQHSGDLRLLLTLRHRLQDVPSWVPDFRRLQLPAKINCETPVHISPDQRVIYLQGIRMAPICDKVGEWDDPRHYTNGIQPDLHYRIRYVEGRIFKPASQIRNVALEEIINGLCWKVSRLFGQGGIDGVRKAYSKLRGHSSPGGGAWLSKRQRAKTTDAFGKNYVIADEIRHCLVLLDDGTILSVRREAVEIMPDDLACVFKGAPHPIIIRPSSGGRNFVLVGYCEIMSGTFFRQPFDEDFWEGRELDEFRLT